MRKSTTKSRILWKIVIAFSCIWLPHFLYSQSIENKDNYIFHPLEEYTNVLDAYQDKQGFIWNANVYGLVRWDGINRVLFRNKPNDPTSIAGNWITALEPDQNGNFVKSCKF